MPEQEGQNMAQKRNVDYQSLVSQADIYYSAPVFENYKGMPVGNGVTGSIVWMGPDRLKFQINRVDVFAANGATTAGEPDMTSPDYLGHQEYCGGCAFLDISFGRDVFTETDSVQHLRMYDAELGLEGRNLQASLRVWAERDVFCLDVKDLSGKPEPVSITLSMLRPAHVVRKKHTADSRVFSREGMIGLTQTFSETCDTGVEGNDHFCASAVLASAKGCTIAETKLDSERCVTLTLLPETSQYSLYIASGASFQSLEQAEKDAQSAMFAAFSAGKEQIENSHRDWWHDYWSRSYIDTSFDRRYSLYWYTYLYFPCGAAIRRNLTAFSLTRTAISGCGAGNIGGITRAALITDWIPRTMETETPRCLGCFCGRCPSIRKPVSKFGEGTAVLSCRKQKDSPALKSSRMTLRRI